MRWRFEPRFDFGRREPPPELSLRTWDAGDGSFELEPERRATFALRLGRRCRQRARSVERELERTSAYWMDWSGRARYDGPWREQVVRSALVAEAPPVRADRRDRRCADDLACPSGSAAS